MGRSFRNLSEKIIGNHAGLQCLCHPTVWICLSDRAEEVELIHQSADLLQVHDDRRISMEQRHVDTSCPFGEAVHIISIKDQFKILSILLLLSFSCLFSLFPGIITTPGDSPTRR